jgi:hypothetical protein
MRRAATLFTLAVLATAVPARGWADVPTPKVVKAPADAPGSPSRNYPFFATDIVLANFGYVEEEFFYEGTANTYAAAELGKNAEITKSGIPFRSRMLVRRPKDAARFNGVVVVEWLNVTNGYDTDVLWLYQKEFLIREGYAWVGVSAQDGGVSREPNGIKVWSPKRYGPIDLTAGGTVTEASLNFDIYSQAGAAVKHVPEVLGGLKPALVIAAGQSQSAGRMGPYLNGVHARDPIYDAALLTVNNQAMRTDLTIPVIKVLSETERFSSRSQPDSAKVRVWNVAGSTHSEQYSLLSRAAFLERDLKLPAVDTCETPARSRVEIRYVYNAAIDWLVKWKKTGAEPPHAPPLQFDENAPAVAQTAAAPAGAPPAGGARQGGGRQASAGGGAPGGAGGRGGAAPEKPVLRDARGNILGGIRLPDMEAPVALESGELCGLGGTHVPFDTATLKTLYPTHDAYVAKVTAAANAAVKAGFLLQADAAQAIDFAKRSIYGLGLECGPLCADLRQFPSNPSSMLLSKQTSYLMIKGSEAAVAAMDDATRLIAEGYTEKDAAASKKRFAAAAQKVTDYAAKITAIRAKGDMPAETSALLVKQAETLRGLLDAKSK